jgi:hypothetical protein
LPTGQRALVDLLMRLENNFNILPKEIPAGRWR